MNIFEWTEQTPVTANNLNEMQNIINNNIYEKYSTTEQVIGTWENSDGTQQPIYRRMKYFTTTNQAQSTWTPIFEISNIKDIIGGRMGITADSGAIDYPWSAAWYDNLFRYNNGNVEYYGDRAHKINYVYVEYTKTTD